MQFKNALEPIFFVAFDNVTDCNFVHPLNALEPIEAVALPVANVFKLVQPANALEPILFITLFNLTVVRFLQPLKVFDGIDLMLAAFVKSTDFMMLALNAPLLSPVTLYVAFVIFVSFTVSGNSISLFAFPSAESPVSCTFPSVVEDAG